MPTENDRADRLGLYWYFIISLAGYVFLSYFTLRSQTELVLGIYVLLFLNYYRFYSKADESNFDLLFNFGLIFRIVLLTSIPNLSDDFYRFLWDGYLLNAGIDPFAKLPSEVVSDAESIPGITYGLYNNLNSPNYFTIYPPLNQAIFWLATWLFSGSQFWAVIAMKAFVIGADVGNMFWLKKLSRIYRLRSKSIFLYILNPLVIIELSGNLHFESIMIFFLLWSIYLFSKGSTLSSAASLAGAILAKLIPLTLLPLFLRKLSIDKLAGYYALVLVIVALGTLPFISAELVEGMSSSISLYFQSFEFNGSIYAIFREIGYWIEGYNAIAVVGKIMAALTFVLIMTYSLSKYALKARLADSFLMVLSIYFFLATTIHPWYITTLVALGTLTSFRYPIVWSFFIYFTYSGYRFPEFQENVWMVVIEYLAVYGFLLYEIMFKQNQRTNFATG